MPSAVSFPPHIANQHGCHAPPAAKDDVNRNGDVVSEHEVVEEINSEEENNIREPADKRNCPWLKKKGRMRGGKVMGPREESRYDELNKGDEKT